MLLIRHLSSFSTHFERYDESIWPSVGIANVLRRNSVPRVGSPFGRGSIRLSQSVSLILASPIRLDFPLRTSNANLALPLVLPLRL